MFHNVNFVASRTETIDFKAFMNREHRKNIGFHRKWGKAYSFIPINPWAFVDPLFLSLTAGIFAVALFERSMANHGHIVVAEMIYTFLKIAFPIVGIAAMFYLLGELRF